MHANLVKQTKNQVYQTRGALLFLFFDIIIISSSSSVIKSNKALHFC